jgi:hypothetical protein
MKKSKAITLVLISAALASCNKKKENNDWEGGSKTYVRSDSTARYSHTHFGSGLLWFYAFRSFGGFNNGVYSRQGYYSNAIPHSSNVGFNSRKAGISRGGFGRSGSSRIGS